MYLQRLHSERINALKHSRKAESNILISVICTQRNRQGSIYLWGMTGKSVLWPWKLQLQVISTFFGWSDSISFVDVIFSRVYWCFHCVREATSFNRQSFPLNQRAYWLILEVKLGWSGTRMSNMRRWRNTSELRQPWEGRDRIFHHCLYTLRLAKIAHSRIITSQLPVDPDCKSSTS